MALEGDGKNIIAVDRGGRVDVDETLQFAAAARLADRDIPGGRAAGERDRHEAAIVETGDTRARRLPRAGWCRAA